MIGYIYKIENTINGKCYIGKTKRLKARWADHRTDYKRSNNKFYWAIRKYGLTNFEFSVIFTIFDYDSHGSEIEKLIIADFDSYRNGYNSTTGGEGVAGRVSERRIDYVGKSYGAFTIIADAPDRVTTSGNISRRIVCKCICGKLKIYTLSNITTERIVSCGCLTKPKPEIDHSGKQYWGLTVIADAPKTVSGQRKVLVRCKCGTEKVVWLYPLIEGRIKSCGCGVDTLKRELMILGKKFYNVRAAAQHFSVNVRTINRWIYSGKNNTKEL